MTESTTDSTAPPAFYWQQLGITVWTLTPDQTRLYRWDLGAWSQILTNTFTVGMASKSIWQKLYYQTGSEQGATASPALSTGAADRACCRRNQT